MTFGVSFRRLKAPSCVFSKPKPDQAIKWCPLTPYNFRKPIPTVDAVFDLQSSLEIIVLRQ